jgi:hypothetical protein
MRHFSRIAATYVLWIFVILGIFLMTTNSVSKSQSKVLLRLSGDVLRCADTRSRQFFSGPLKQFEKLESWTSIKGKKFTRLKNADIIDAIGESEDHAPLRARLVFAYSFQL